MVFALAASALAHSATQFINQMKVKRKQFMQEVERKNELAEQKDQKRQADIEAQRVQAAAIKRQIAEAAAAESEGESAGAATPKRVRGASDQAMAFMAEQAKDEQEKAIDLERALQAESTYWIREDNLTEVRAALSIIRILFLSDQCVACLITTAARSGPLRRLVVHG